MHEYTFSWLYIFPYIFLIWPGFDAESSTHAELLVQF